MSIRRRSLQLLSASPAIPRLHKPPSSTAMPRKSSHLRTVPPFAAQTTLVMSCLLRSTASRQSPSPCGFIHTNNAIHWASFTADGCYIVRTMERYSVHTRFDYYKILQKTMFCERLPVQYFKLSSPQEYPYSRERGYSCCRRQHIPILQTQFSAACLTPFI